MEKRFTLRQQRYKINRIAGMNQYNAAKAAGYSENYSRNARPERVVKGSIVNALEQAGLTPSYRAKEIMRLTKSKRDEICLNTHKHIGDLLGDVKNRVEHSGLSGETKIIIIRGDIGTESKTPAVSGQVRI